MVGCSGQAVETNGPSWRRKWQENGREMVQPLGCSRSCWVAQFFCDSWSACWVAQFFCGSWSASRASSLCLVRWVHLYGQFGLVSSSGIFLCPLLVSSSSGCGFAGSRWGSRLARRVTHGAAPCTLMQCSNDASQCRCTRAVAHRGARCNPVHHHRDAPRCRCTQVVVHRAPRCTTVHMEVQEMIK